MGGRGSRSGGMGRNNMSGGSELKNTGGASPEAVSLFGRAVQDIGTFGSAHVEVGTTTDRGVVPKAADPKNSTLEKQLTDLGNENGYIVSFDTKTTTKKDATRAYKYGSSAPTKTQTKVRTMHVYRAGGAG